jgi:hypothetical protein
MNITASVIAKIADFLDYAEAHERSVETLPETVRLRSENTLMRLSDRAYEIFQDQKADVADTMLELAHLQAEALLAKRKRERSNILKHKKQVQREHMENLKELQALTREFAL